MVLEEAKVGGKNKGKKEKKKKKEKRKKKRNFVQPTHRMRIIRENFLYFFKILSGTSLN